MQVAAGVMSPSFGTESSSFVTGARVSSSLVAGIDALLVGPGPAPDVAAGTPVVLVVSPSGVSVALLVAPGEVDVGTFGVWSLAAALVFVLVAELAALLPAFVAVADEPFVT